MKIVIETNHKDTATLLAKVARAMPKVERVRIDGAEGPTTPPTDPGGPDDVTIIEKVRIEIDDSSVTDVLAAIDAAKRDAIAEIARAGQ